MEKENSPLDRHSQLDLLLQWEGSLNNARLREIFDLQQVRASEWIREFRERHPGWTEWNSKTRSYHATADAYQRRDQSRANAVESLSRYLSLTGLPHAGYSTPASGVMLAGYPDISLPQPKVFATLARAARSLMSAEITYRSMRDPAPHKRVIAPHTLIRAGRRWHARAYCATNNDFRDFALGRIVDAKLLETEAQRVEKDDAKWMASVPVQVMAHPDLTRDQIEMVRFEYFNETSSRIDICRGSLIAYYVQDIRAAIDIKTQRPPDYQLAIENIDEVRPWLFPT